MENRLMVASHKDDGKEGLTMTIKGNTKFNNTL